MTSALHEDFDANRRLLWGIAYRMTGVAADADDVVQETFARALTSPPARDRPVRPWLVKVAMNIARDTLRRRRRRPYMGPWLPSPVPDDALDLHDDAGLSVVSDDKPGPEQRVSMRQSATFAFLLALERLTPQRRAVLILRDVFDYSTEETAEALGMRGDAVKQALLRARRAIAVDVAPARVKRERDREALGRLFAALVGGDTASVEALLASDVEAMSDGGGEVAAAKIVLRGRQQVAKVYKNLIRLLTSLSSSIVDVNGTVAALTEADSRVAGAATRSLLAVDTNERGEITRIYTVLATRKLTAV